MAISRAQGKKEGNGDARRVDQEKQQGREAGFPFCLSAKIRTYGLLIDRMHALPQGRRHEVSGRRRWVDPAHCRGVAARRHDIVRPPGKSVAQSRPGKVVLCKVNIGSFVIVVVEAVESRIQAQCAGFRVSRGLWALCGKGRQRSRSLIPHFPQSVHSSRQPRQIHSLPRKTHRVSEFRNPELWF